MIPSVVCMTNTTQVRPPAGTASRDRGGVRGLIARHPLVSFFTMALGLSWLAWVPYILSPHGMGVWDIHFPEVLGSGQFTGVLPGALLGPLGSAFIVTAVADGRAGLRRWVGRLFRWRVAWYWYALALVVVPALIVVSALPFAGGDVRAPSALAFAMLVPGLIIQLFSTGLSEEPGWRDFALPRLQHRLGAVRGTVVLGLLWGGWHLPLFLTEWGGFPGVSWTQPVLFIASCVPLSLVMTWVFNRTGQSVPLVMLLHAGINSTYTLLWPAVFPTLDAGGDTLVVQLVATTAATAVLLVVTRGRLGAPPRGPSATGSSPVPRRDSAALPR